MARLWQWASNLNPMDNVRNQGAHQELEGFISAGRSGQPLKNSGGLCKGYDGILFISRVIRKAGAGTLFFQSLVDSLLYAEKYNLYPFLHINNNMNRPCYDIKVHGIGPNITFQHLMGRITNLEGRGSMACGAEKSSRPGPPDLSNLKMNEYTLIGNGLWNSYFEPVSPFPFHDASCQDKPVFEMRLSQVMPGMHRCSEFGVRGWPFDGIPDALMPNGRPLREWLWDSREPASNIVKRHFRLLPWIEQKVERANPEPRKCLAAHIRLTDKAHGRDKKGLEFYQAYIEAYANVTKDNPSPIYVATDDGTVLETIRQKWTKEASSRVIVQPGVQWSDNNLPTFKILENDKHRANTEALVEMYAMSKCSFFIHGFSGMAEAVVYINPRLHNRSVNIDDEAKPSPEQFADMIKTAY